MDSNNNRFTIAILIFIGLIIIVLSWSSITSYFETKTLRDKITQNLQKIDSLEIKNTYLVRDIKRDSIKIESLSESIAKLGRKKDSVFTLIKKNRYESKKINKRYLSSDINERVGIFSGLATESN